MSRRVWAVLMLITASFLSPASAHAGDVASCPSDVDLHGVHQFCHYSSDEFQMLVSTQSDGISYAVKPMCVETQDPGDGCINQQRCEAPPDTFRFMVFRSSPGSPDVPWGTVCLGTDEVEVITPGRVLAEMKRLSWPEAELSVQPPGGRTLVNFKTNFFTTTTDPTTQTISLLGQQVRIEATPIRYTWHFGDGDEQTGAQPGAPYPDLTITHVYRDSDTTVHPRLDVTYHGRYRVEDGDWHDIPEELTVQGTPTELQVLSATPHLVG